MGGVDDRPDAVLSQIGGKTVLSAEPADPDLPLRQSRTSGAADKGADHPDIGTAGKNRGKRVCLPGAA
jgi:hypothetical protein